LDTNRGFPLFVEFNDALFVQPLQSELDHADRAFHDPLPGTDYGTGPAAGAAWPGRSLRRRTAG